MVAMTSRLRARWLATALATPTPPTSKRGQADQGEELAEALDIAFELRRGLVAGADVPAGIGKLGCGLLLERGDGAVARVRVRQAQPVLPAHQAAGLQQPGGAQRRLADQQARPKADAAGELVGLAVSARAQLDRGLADGDAVAGLEIEPRQQCRIGGGAEGVARARANRAGKRHGGIGRDRAESG